MITNFVNNNTVIDATWLNKVDRAISEAIGSGSDAPTTPVDVKTNLSLDNVNNTSDINKPISSATQTALNAKAEVATTVERTGSTGAALMPSGTTVQRDTSTLGAFRYNSQLDVFEGLIETGWTPFGASTAANMSFTPTGNIAATNTQSAIAEVDTEKVAKAGDTMSGALNVTDATAATHAMNRQTSDARYLALSGGTVSGQIKGITPINAEDLTRKDYVDTKVATYLPLSGGTLTSSLTLNNGTLFVKNLSGSGNYVYLGGNSSAGYPYIASNTGHVQIAGYAHITSMLGTSNAANMHVATGENGLIYVSTSSKRFKQNIEPLSLVPYFDQLKPIKYDSTHSKDSNTSFIGFAVEDLTDLDPRLGDGDSYYDYRALIAILVAEVQDLRKRVKDLEKINNHDTI